MIRPLHHIQLTSSAPMKLLLRPELPLTDEAFGQPQEELLPLKWSIAVWLVLAALSWGAVYFVLSLIL